MNKSLIRLFSAMLLLFTLATSVSGFMPESVTVTGTIYELESDDDGNPTAVWLETEAQSYVIHPSGKGKELTGHVGSRAKVTGTVSQNAEDEYPTLTVSSYEIMGQSE